MIASSVHAAEKETDHAKIMEALRAQEEHVGVWQRYGFAGLPLVPPGRDAPKIDGTVDAREWTAAAQLGGMVDYNKGLAVRDKTTVFLCYTPAHLYLAFQIGRPQNARTPTEQDLFEILIDASHQQAKYYNLAVTPTKVAWTGVGPNVDKKAWQPAIEYKARATDFGWEGELAIPFKEFKPEARLPGGGQAAPAPGAVWGIDFVRNEKTPTDRLAVWTFRGKDWHATKNLGHIMFTGQAVAVRAEGIGWIENSSQRGVKLRVSNFSDQAVALETSLELRKANGPLALEYYPTIDTAMTEDLGAAIGSPLKNEVAGALKNYTVQKTRAEKITIAPNASTWVRLLEPEEPGNYLALYSLKEGDALLAGGLLPFRVLVPLAIKLESYLYSANTLAYEVDLRRLIEKISDRSAMTVRVIEKDGKVAAEAKHASIKGKEEIRGELTFAPKPDSSCSVCVSLTDGDKEVAKNEEALRIPPKPEWLGNPYGKKKFVPEPWKPVKAGEKECEVLMAKYAWDGRSLMPNVTTPGHAILAKPPQLTFKGKDGNEISVKISGVKLVEHDVEQAIYAIAADLGNQATVNARVKIEFDGLVWYQLTLRPKPTIDLTGIALEFALHKDFAQLCTAGHGITSQTNANFSAAIPAEGIQFPYTFMYWVGGVEGGVQWFAENNRNWHNASEHNAVQVTRGGSTGSPRDGSTGSPHGNTPGSLKINFIDKAVTLDKATEWSFGFMPTPTRVKPKGWAEFAFFQTAGMLSPDIALAPPNPELAKTNPKAHDKWRLRYKYFSGESWKRDRKLLSGMIFHSGWPELFGYPGTYEPARQKALKDSVRWLHHDGIKVVVYAGWGMHTEGPEWKDYGTEMVMLPLKNKGYGTFHECMASLWQDWFVFKTAQMIKDYDIDGLFIDSATSVVLSENYVEGMRWTDAKGKTRGSYPLLATRAWLKRLYKLWHGELKPDGVIYNHQSPPTIMMIENFADVRCPSEFAQHHEGSFDRKFLDYYVAKNGGEQFGLFIEHTSKDWMGAWARKKTNQLFAICLPLNVSLKAVALWNTSLTCNSYALDAQPQPWIWAAHKWANRSAAEYLPWWKNSGYVTTTPNDDQILTALWLHKGDKALLCVSNLKNEPRDIQVALNLGALGFNKIEVEDAITGEKIPAAGGSLRVKIDFERYRLLKLTNQK
ncbi:MAG: hypothetical protein HY360_06195 [Verrucomicrobia bacterium]|nr:hypothetical protein [Verrucomicrobiota bacterium]